MEKDWLGLYKTSKEGKGQQKDRKGLVRTEKD